MSKIELPSQLDYFVVNCKICCIGLLEHSPINITCISKIIKLGIDISSTIVLVEELSVQKLYCYKNLFFFAQAIPSSGFLHKDYQFFTNRQIKTLGIITITK